MTSHDVVARGAARARRARSGHAGTLDPFATGLLLVLLGRATRLQRFLIELPKTYRGDGAARLALEHRRPRRRADRDRAACPSSLELPTGDGAPARADDLGGAGRRRAPLPQGPPRRGGRDPRTRGRGLPRRAARQRRRERRVRDRVLGRAPTSAPWSRPSTTPTARELRRTAIGPFRASRTPARSSPSDARVGRAGPGRGGGPAMSPVALRRCAMKRTGRAA